MATCPHCGHETQPRARFCEQCGGALVERCSACTATLPPASRFCPGCGQPVGALADRPPSAPTAYTPAHLKERILTSRASLEGERKHVTVLFADLRGSMELVAGLDPEEARLMLDGVVGRMMAAVHRYEGTVNQVMGDGLMALFGAPLAHEDHALRACYAALDMQLGIEDYAADLRRTQGVSVQIRVGLNSGEVVVRSIQSDLHMDYSAVGPTTHLAARMEQVAVPGTVVLTAETWRLVEGRVEVKALGPVAVKGVAAPVEVFQLLGAVEVRSRLHSPPGRSITPFVGREAELAELGRVLERAADKHGQVMAVVGEPGVGKSRLILELARSPWVREWQLLETGALAYEHQAPYRAVAALLRAYFRIQLRDDGRATQDKIVSRLSALGLSLDATVSPLLAVLDVPIEEAAWQALSAAQCRRRILDAVVRVLLRASELEPLLLVVEDLHWLDAESQAVLDALVDGLLGARVLLLVTYRPEYQHGWGSRASYHQLRLEPLPAAAADEMLARLLGPDPSLQPLKTLLADNAEGNPFFLEESVLSVIESSALEGEPGAFRLSRPVDAVRIPASVEAVLAARIDRLKPQEKRLLQSAAVIGRDVPLSLLEAIVDEPAEALRGALSQLQASEFLYETHLFPEVEYTFKHGLTHDVAYRALLHSQRRSLHARIVETFERLYPGRVADQAERLADHAMSGELFEKAAGYLHQAGRKAAARGAGREAVATFERALAALARLDDRREVLDRAIEVRLDLQSTLIPSGDLPRILASLREAEALGQRVGDPRRTGQVAAAMSFFFWWTGEPARSAEFGHRAWEVAQKVDDLELQVVTNLRLVQAYFAMGEYRRVAEVGRWNLDTLTGALGRQMFGLPALPAVTIRAFVGRSIASLGEFDAGIALVEEGVRLAEGADQPYTKILAYWGAGDAYLMRGDLPRAIAALEQGLDLCRRGEFALMTPIIGRILGEAYALAGRHDEATAQVERSVETLTAMRYIPALPSAWAGLGEVHLVAGRLPEALAAAQRAAELCEQHGQQATHAAVLRLLGDVHAVAVPAATADAEAAYRRALALSERLALRPLSGRCHLGLGKLWARTAKLAQASNQVARAEEIFRSLSLTSWLDETSMVRRGLATSA